jgi:hypothetical protein
MLSKVRIDPSKEGHAESYRKLSREIPVRIHLHREHAEIDDRPIKWGILRRGAEDGDVVNDREGTTRRDV